MAAPATETGNPDARHKIVKDQSNQEAALLVEAHGVRFRV